MPAWIVARVVANVESTVVARLARLDTESYWPKFAQSVIDRRSHRKRKIIKPLYPCYLFVKSRLFYFLFDVDGITGVVMEGESPASSDRLDAEITRMRSGERDGLVPAPIVEIAPRLTVGRRVVVISGVLRGHVGTCNEFRGSNVKIVTNLFGGETPVWHSETNLAAA
jgi:transcription antitermination factor NusG